MVCAQHKASAPGSIMLFGEHAVLHGEPAIVAAVDKRIHVTLIPRHDDIIRIDSDQFSHYETVYQNIVPESPYHFVLAAIQLFQAEISQGFDLHIQSDFLPTLGLGSSAAVTVASLGVLNQWLAKTMTRQELALQARHIIRQQQGRASGADIMASTYGGIVYYEVDPLRIDFLPILENIVLVYSGYKTKTADVIRQVESLAMQTPDKFEQLYRDIGDCTKAVRHCLQQPHCEQFSKLVQEHQNLQQALGTSDQVLADIIGLLTACDTIDGAKISGSGLGDCVVGFGAVNQDFQDTIKHLKRAQLIPLQLTPQGIYFNDD